MELGWIDFSETERSKVMDVLSLLADKGTLDELGISAVRDGFANTFFPGTSTVQTRAKYFFIVPYIAREMERNDEQQYGRLRKLFDKYEKDCALKLMSQDDLDGIIGRRVLSNISNIRKEGWVKRSPASIYWAGLRKYKIYLGGESLARYLEYMASLKPDKKALKNLGNRNDKKELDQDDIDAGDGLNKRFWNIPTYRKDWYEKLTMALTEPEKEFLKESIKINCKGSLLADIVEHDWIDFFDYVSEEDEEGNDFLTIAAFLEKHKAELSANILSLYKLALDFSKFLYALRVVYNLVASQEKSEEANNRFYEVHTKFKEYTKVDLDQIFNKLKLWGPNDSDTLSFLKQAKNAMEKDEVEALKELITNREIDLKGKNRAKTYNHEAFRQEEWFSGYYLDYRLPHAVRILRDIYAKEDE